MERRTFLAAASVGRVLGANDRINVGFIGTGGMGTSHLRSFKRQSDEEKNVQIVSVCDVYTKRKERARTTAALEEKDVHHDYKDLLARNDVDAVVIASPDHWHGRMALDAIRAGKDVYLQKPMTYTIAEAKAISDAAAKHGRVVQVGSQHLSDPRTQLARKLIEAGEIGDLLWAQGTSSRNSRAGEWNYTIEPEGTPETIDWNRWLGSAPKRPFSPERYFRWRKYWDYSGGIATDLFYHKLGPILFAMGAQFPTVVTGSGGIYVQKDRDVPDTCAAVIEYPSFYINLSGSMANAAGVRYLPTVIYGHNGTLIFEQNRVVVLPEQFEQAGARRVTAAAPESSAKVHETEPVKDLHRLHTDNWLSCIRSRKQPHLNPLLGYQIMVAIRLTVDAYRESRTKYFDGKLEKTVDKAPARPAYEGKGLAS